MFVYFPVKKFGRVYKFARPFHGPYLIEEVFDNGVQLKRVDQPKIKSLHVTLNRMRKCLRELTNSTTDHDELLEGVNLEQDLEQVGDTLEEEECTNNTWSTRLRSRRRVEPPS